MNHHRFTWLCVGLLLAMVISRANPIAGAPTDLETVRVSVSSSGEQGNHLSYIPIISPTGRFVVFSSRASNLVAGDTNGKIDLFIHDRRSGQTTRLVVGTNGTQANGASYASRFAAGDRYVTFYSFASNLVPNDTNNRPDMFIIDRHSGEIERVSVSSSGEEGNGASGWGLPSADGRYVVYDSDATNLVPDDTNGVADIFIHDRQTGETKRVSVNSHGRQGNGHSYLDDLSADGRLVVFQSAANNLVPGDTANCFDGFGPRNCGDVFVHNVETGQTTRISVSSSGEQGNNHSGGGSLSADGRFIAFSSGATNFGPGDSGMYVLDRVTGQLEHITLLPGGPPPDQWVGGPTLSADGRFVLFVAYASNLVPGDTNDEVDVFVFDRQTGETTRVSVTSSGAEAHGWSTNPHFSADGRTVVFESDAPDLVPGDTNDRFDIFVRRWREPPNLIYLSIIQRGE